MDQKLTQDIFTQKNPIVLAPMEGVVDWEMRDTITRLGGFDLCVTEFIRVTDIPATDDIFFKFCPELRTQAKTRAGVPVLIQLLGGQPGPMAESALRAVELGAPGIDLNFGCPAKTVNRSDGGAALLKNPRRVFDVVSAVRAEVPKIKTVSAKVRLGFSDKSQFLEIAQAAAEGGAAWLTVHARTRDEGYRPPAHWEYISRIREALSIPVIANGDIWSLSDYERCREVSGCNAVMLGRGAIRSPELALRAKGLLDRKLAWMECFKILVEYTKLLAATRDVKPWKADVAVCRFKQWLKQLRSNHPEALVLFESTKTIENYQDLMTQLQSIYPPAENIK